MTGSAAGLHVVLRPPAGDEAALAVLAQRCGLDARPLGPYAIGGARRGRGWSSATGTSEPSSLATAVASFAAAGGATPG